MRVGLLSPYLGSNLGDNAILSSLMSVLSDCSAGCRFSIVCLAPTNVARLHSCDAFPIRKLKLPFYDCEGSISLLPDRLPHEDAPGRRTLSLRHVAKRLPGLRTLVHWFRLPAITWSHRRAALAMLQKLDILIVGGGGQLDAEYAGAFGHPYSLWLWSRWATACKVPFVVVGVGASKGMSWLSHALIRSALKRSARTSVRDDWSLQLTRSLVPGRQVHLTSDLAFSYPLQPANRDAGLEQGRTRLVVGISPIVYLRKGAWPQADQSRYLRYLKALDTCVRTLVDRQIDVQLFISEASDNLAVQELIDSLGPHYASRLTVHPQLNLDAHLALMQTFDIAVVSRLHGAILSQLAGVPTIAISFHSKVDEQMRQTDSESLVVSFDQVDGNAVADMVIGTARELDRHEARVRQKVEGLRAAASHEIKQIYALIPSGRALPANPAVAGR